MDLFENWKGVKAVFRDSFASSLRYAIATVGENAERHATLIGSLAPCEAGHGFYVEKFTRHLPHNLGVDNRLCVLAVNNPRRFWLKSTPGGRFSDPPAMPLHGIVIALRPARARELELRRRRVRRVRFTKGHALMWGYGPGRRGRVRLNRAGAYRPDDERSVPSTVHTRRVYRDGSWHAPGPSVHAGCRVQAGAAR